MFDPNEMSFVNDWLDTQWERANDDEDDELIARIAGMRSKFAQTERVIAAAREWKIAEDKLAVYPVQTFEQGDHHLDPPVSDLLTCRFHAKRAFWDALKALDRGADGEADQ